MQNPSSDASAASSHVIPLVCVFGVVVLLTSITLVIKYVFQHSDVQPMNLASVRVAIGFVLLCAMTLLWDRHGLLSLKPADVMRLTFVGVLGVFSYLIAACGLMHTSVIHYTLIYSLLPSVTALLGVFIGREQLSPAKVTGIALSLCGCSIAVTGETLSIETALGVGDALVLLFTIMMSAHIVFSAGIVKRFGVMVANTVMFGSSALLLFAASWEGMEPKHADVSPLVLSAVTYVGFATAVVFLLRYRALQILPPAIVGTYHNLIPICTILSAGLFLHERIGLSTILGSATVVAGTELVRRSHLPQWLVKSTWLKWVWRSTVTEKPSHS